MGYNLRKTSCKGIVIKKWDRSNTSEDTLVAKKLFERVPSIYQFLISDLRNGEVLFLQEQPYGDKGQTYSQSLDDYIPKATTMRVGTYECFYLMENTVYAK